MPSDDGGKGWISFGQRGGEGLEGVNKSSHSGQLHSSLLSILGLQENCFFYQRKFPCLICLKGFPKRKKNCMKIVVKYKYHHL